MKAARLTAPRTVSIDETDTPAPARGQVLVRVLACGVCGSDLNAWRGVPGIEFPLPPGVPGHEVWGHVAALGPGVSADEELRLGQDVTGFFQGGYAQYALAPAEEVIAIPSGLAGRVVLGEPLACAANIVRRVGARPGDRVAIVGFGYIASLVIQLLFPDRRGEWIAISRRQESRERALNLGARAAYGYDGVPSSLWDSFPVVIEATGVQQALDYATWLTAYGGRLVIAGYHADGPRTINMQSWNWKGIDVVNAHEREPSVHMRGLRDGLRAVQAYDLHFETLVSHRWPLDRVADALRMAEDRPDEYVKGLVVP